MTNINSYKTSILINGQKIIPSDIFESSTSRYVLMDIKDVEGKIVLEIMALSGIYASRTFFIDKDIFSKFTLKEFEESLKTYKEL